jgi:hypothetical protein
MRYLCLGYYDPERYDALSEDQLESLRERCRPHDEAFRATGRVVTVASLEHGTGVRIHPTASGPSVTDGPFTEAKEIVGSYFLVEAADLDEAVHTASLHPAARMGRDLGWFMEVRPVEHVWVEDGEFVPPPGKE